MVSSREQIEKVISDATANDSVPRPLHHVLFTLAHTYNVTAQLMFENLGSTKNAAFEGPAIMCRSFAIELLLKFFIVIEYPAAQKLSELTAVGINLRGQTYLGLFDKIKAPRQEQIAKKCADLSNQSTTPNDFRNLLLALGDNSFDAWRYVYESENTKYLDLTLVNSVADSLGLAAHDSTRVADIL